MEETPWPSWLTAIWPTWLEQTGYPSDGVGDLQDLKFVPSVSNNGKWIGYINTGWYYHRDNEQYNYVLVGTISVTGAIGSGSVTTTSFRPSWGPVLLYDTATNEPYKQHHNSFYPGYAPTWSLVNSGVYVATLPTSSYLVAMRNLTTLPLGAVASTGLLISDKLYYYDLSTNKVYHKPKTTPISAWADLVFILPQLRMRELVVQTASGVLPSYTRVRDVYVLRGTQSYYASALHTSGYLTHTLSGNTGDWFVLDYLIDKSFILEDHQTLRYYSSTASSNISIYHETSLPDTYQPITISSGSTGTLNLNPVFSDAFRAGYLFHANPASSLNSYWTPSNLELSLDKDNICRTWNEYLMVKICVTEENGLPIPNYPLSISTSGCTTALTFPNSGFTDNRGEAYYYLQAISTATSISVTGIVGSMTKIVSASVSASGSMVSLTEWLDGHGHILVSRDKTGDGAFRLFTSVNNLDGCPRPGSLTLETELASEFRDKTNLYTNSVVIDHSQGNGNVCSVSEIGYIPQPNDKIFGKTGVGQSRVESIE